MSKENKFSALTPFIIDLNAYFSVIDTTEKKLECLSRTIFFDYHQWQGNITIDMLISLLLLL